MSGSAGGEAQSSNATYQRPKTRQRVQKAPPSLSVPDINDDADERKRVLNVLAQRRYRERKRMGRKAATRTNDSAQEAPGFSEQPSSAEPTSHSLRPEPGSAAEGGTAVDPLAQEGAACLMGPGSMALGMDFPASGAFGHLNALNCEPVDSADLLSDFLSGRVGLLPPNPADGVSMRLEGSQLSATIDPAALFRTPSPSGSSEGLSADSYLLPMSDLTLLRAFLRIADRLGCTNTIWDLAAISHFCSPTVASSSASSSSLSLDMDPVFPTSPSPSSARGRGALPPPWEPTAAQLLLQHHPVLDFLPWPLARDRIISIFSLPEQARPAAARSPLALVQFVYDLEDTAEGIRIWGGDPYDPGAWEVGQVLFERWWFIFDRAIIEQSNRWRRIRGAAELRMIMAPSPGAGSTGGSS
ncbi:hypothetical protein GQ53DRAFT_842563 [Thozetella sp. PMI_491]|nr:hypothetical protein GQ53DRAFT_842563 [Thozetella sp. PMI_491]